MDLLAFDEPKKKESHDSALLVGSHCLWMHYDASFDLAFCCICTRVQGSSLQVPVRFVIVNNT